MSFAGNLLWFIFGFGWFWGTFYLVMGCLACCTVIGIPFGIAIFRFAKFVYFPFGRELVDAADVGEKLLPGTEIAAFFWVMLVGTFSALGFVISALCCFCGLFTIPFGLVYLRLATAVFNPLGKRVVPKVLADTIRSRKANAVLDAMEAGKGPARMRWALRPHLIVAVVLSLPMTLFWMNLPFRLLTSSSHEPTASVGGRFVGNTPSPAVVETADTVREKLGRTLVHSGYATKIVSLTVLGELPQGSGTCRAKVVYNEPLYAFGERTDRCSDEARDVAFRINGGSWRDIRLLAAAETEVPSLLKRGFGGEWTVAAENAEAAVFPSGFARHCADAALFEEGSEAEKALRQILGRALAVAGQVKADRANRRTDPMAAARLAQNQRALEMASSTLGTFLREHRGQVVKALPETLTQPFGVLAEESATKARDTVDVEAVLREINRRLPIAGYTLRFSAIEVLAHAMDGQREVYHLRVKVDQPVYTLGERMTGWVSPDNRNVRLSGLPGWRVVTLRHPAGEAFEMDLQMARPGTRNPDAIAFDEHGAPGLTVVDVVRNKGRNDLLLTAGSPAQAAWEGMLGRALGLSKAIYEDANLRRNDRSAKTRYDANRKALAAFQKELKAYAKGLVGKVSESLQGLPMPPEPRR